MIWAVLKVIKMKLDKHIEIVRSSVPGLSSMSERSCSSVYSVLKNSYTNVGITTVNNLADLIALVAAKPDLVFLGMKFLPVNPSLGFHDPDKIWITDYLDKFNITYTGSSQKAHELELNKHLAKQCVINAGLSTSPYFVAIQNQPQKRVDMVLAFPLFIKPTNRGGGQGIDSKSVVNNFDEMRLKVESLGANFQSDSLVEEYLSGREFSVAILKTISSQSHLIMPIELIAQKNKNGERLLSGEMKSANSEVVVGLSDEMIKSKINTLAINVFHAIGAQDYGRIDIRLDGLGNPHFLEANLLPSLIEDYGSFPKACVINAEMDYKEMILHIVKLGFAHKVKRDNNISSKQISSWLNKPTTQQA